MLSNRLDFVDLQARFSDSDNIRLNGFLPALEDQQFQAALSGESILDVWLDGDTGPPAVPSAKPAIFDGVDISVAGAEPVDLIVAASVVHRVANPFRLLAAIRPLLKPNGQLVLSVPLREPSDAARAALPHNELTRHKRLYTIAGLYLELQAAWGSNAFRLQYAREFDARSGSTDAKSAPHSLIMIVQKRGEGERHPDLPQVVLNHPGLLYNRSDDEAVLSIDLAAMLSPGIDPASFRRICVLKLDHIGDFAMGVPVYDDLRQMFPDAEIVCVCGSWNAKFARDLGCFDEVVPCDYYSSGAAGVNSPEEMALAAQQLGDRFKGTLFDLAIDLRVPDDSRVVIEMVPARYRAAIGSAAKYPFLDVALPTFDSFNVGSTAVPDAVLTHIAPEYFSFSNGHAVSPPGVRVMSARAGGHLIWGPYTTLARGCYSITWMLTAVTGSISARVDVAVFDEIRNRVTVLKEAVIEVGPDGTSASLDLELHVDLSRVEFRMQAAGDPEGVGLVFTGVRLEAMSGRPSTRHLSQAQVHMKEQMALLLSLVRTRLLAPARSAEQIRTALCGQLEPATAPFFVIVPFSNSIVRDWPTASFKQLCQSLIRETDAAVRIMGSAAQRAALDTLLAEIGSPRIENHAGAPWADVYADLVRAEAVISNNSGMGHLAAMLGARVLAIYSGSHQVLEWGPIGRSVSVLQASLPCAPCGYDTVGECLHGIRCTQAIDATAVLRSLRGIAPASFSTPAEVRVATNGDSSVTARDEPSRKPHIRNAWRALRNFNRIAPRSEAGSHER